MTNLTQILFSYDFLVVAIGTVLLAIPSAIVGCFSVYKGQSLMADAVGHASYPGVVIAFMLFSVRSSVILTLGAAVVGILAYLTIQMIRKHSVIDFDAALAITLTGFFGLGMVLKSYLQGNSSYMRASQAGLKNYIFGSAAFIMKEDIIMIAICAIIAAVLLALFYKELVARSTVCKFNWDFDAYRKWCLITNDGDVYRCWIKVYRCNFDFLIFNHAVYLCKSTF